jgi:two-component system cell cycle sensor histidine kinase/response regulator CckA
MGDGETEEAHDDGYRLLFESNPRPCLVFERASYAILAVSDAACGLYGWTREEMLAMTVRDLRTGDELVRFDRLMDERRGSSTRGSTNRGWRHLTKSGRLLEVDVESTRLTFLGRPAALLVVTDVTGAAVAERRFRLLVEHCADGIVLVNESGVIEYANPATMPLLGYRPEELVGRVASSLTHPDDAAGGVMPRRGETFVSVSRSRHRDGSWRWVEAATTNLTHEASIRGYVTSFRDVTERKETERAAQDAQRRLEYVLSATSAVTYAASASAGREATFISGNVKRVTGHDAAAFLETPTFWLDQVHPDDREIIETSRRELVANGTCTFRHRFQHADGHYLWLQGASRLVRDEHGQPTETIGYWIDVTEQIHAEETLRRSEANFRMLIERSPTAVFVHREGQIVYVNPPMVAMLGYERAEDLIGRTAFGLISPEDRELARQAMERTRLDGQSTLKATRMLRRDGSSVYLESDGVHIRFDGQPSNVVFARDVTERREMFARIAVADRMLSVGTLAAGVAHEINNPLAYVMANLAILARELPALLAAAEPSMRAAGSALDIETVLEDAQEGAARVSGIVRDLRLLSRGDDETRGPVDVVAVILSSLKMAQNELRHRAVVVRELESGLPPVHANASRLGQVFLNLLVNAAQSIPDGRTDANEVRVRARASADRETVIVEVEDTGAGIPPSVAGRIFDPFFTTKPVGVGTGLGLSICHQIVSSVGGEISVTSEPGSGSCFRVTFPSTTAEALRVVSGTNDSRWTGVTSRVLMVDDEPAIGRSTQLLLAPQHDVVAVTRGRDALDRLAAGERFDVILCDLMMPEMSGIEFHDHLARSAPEYVARVVFMTGGAFTDEARQFLESVGRPHIEKPFTEAALRLVIRDIVTLRS